MWQKLASRKFLTLLGVWMFALGGMLSGQLTVQEALTALGVSGSVYVGAQGIVDAIAAWRKK